MTICVALALGGISLMGFLGCGSGSAPPKVYEAMVGLLPALVGEQQGATQSESMSSTTMTAFVARVQNTAITRAEYDHWYTVAQTNTAKGKAAALKEQTLEFLISAAWVEGEAAERHLQVSPQEVANSYERTKRQHFPHEGEFQRFLSKSGQTEEDLRFRVRLKLLSARIQAQVHASGSTTAVKSFVGLFHKKWRARTYCRPEFMVADCGHEVG
jgi:SurA N-terminal domain